MTFVIITHVPHIISENQYFAYTPYVREMNIWIKYADEVIIAAPVSNNEITAIEIQYVHSNIKFVPLENFNLLSLKSSLRAAFVIPVVCLEIFKVMRRGGHIHLRCPGNVGLLGCFLQILFPKKNKTAKYAGNWDPDSVQPRSYRLQRWILNNAFLTRNIQVLVYGKWKNSSLNIKPFFTASYTDADKTAVAQLELKGKIKFMYVGSLVKGKNPLYAVKIVEKLAAKYDVALYLFGEGPERKAIEDYVLHCHLEGIIFLKGNQDTETLKKEYQSSHFVILISDSEGWPKAIAEGMFWGCVPISSSVSCTPFMLAQGERGILSQRNIEVDLHTIETILQNQENYDKKRVLASEWARIYTMNFFEEEIKNLLKE